MNTCGTCRFWGDRGDRHEMRQRFRRCLAVEHIGDEYDEREKAVTDRAHVIDGSGYYAALKCAADFGCVLHETEAA